ncbi:MAG: DUF6903 family protein [Cellulosilyticaceae bacterium]
MMDSNNKKIENERIVEIIKYVVAAIMFVGALVAIFIGQKNIGPEGLGLMLLGVGVLIFLLYMYNRRFK